MAIRKKMSDDELRRLLDYQVGDLIQVRPDGYEYSGRLGKIIGITFYRERPGKPDVLSYNLKLSDHEGVSVPCYRLRLIREAESDEDLPEKKSQFIPMGKVAKNNE